MNRNCPLCQQSSHVRDNFSDIQDPLKDPATIGCSSCGVIVSMVNSVKTLERWNQLGSRDRERALMTRCERLERIIDERN